MELSIGVVLEPCRRQRAPKSKRCSTEGEAIGVCLENTEENLAKLPPVGVYLETT